MILTAINDKETTLISSIIESRTQNIEIHKNWDLQYTFQQITLTYMANDNVNMEKRKHLK